MLSLILLASYIASVVCRDTSLVQELDRHNFDTIVMDKDKHVLVKFYAPWCGHCKRLEPVFESLAKTFQGEEDCIIAKVDAEYESAIGARYQVRSFPTIKFFSKGNKIGEDYDGDRTEQDFIEYLNQKCGANRLKGGSMNNRAGRIDAFDAFAEKFMTDESYNRTAAIESIMRTAEIEVDPGYKKSMNYYAKVMKKVMEKGETYVATELKRLEKLVDQHIPTDKKTEMLRKKNVLDVFKRAADKDEL